MDYTSEQKKLLKRWDTNSNGAWEDCDALLKQSSIDKGCELYPSSTLPQLSLDDKSLSCLQDLSPLTVQGFLEPFQPQVVGEIIDKECFSRDCSINKDYRSSFHFSLKEKDKPFFLPEPLVQLRPIIQQIIDIEYSILGDNLLPYCFVGYTQNVERQAQKEVSPDPHIDISSFDDYVGKKMDRHYIVSSSTPTYFHVQPYDIVDYVKQYLGRSVSEEEAIKFLDSDIFNYMKFWQSETDFQHVWQAKPYEIVFFNSYNIHHSAPSPDVPTKRSLLHLTFSDTD